MSTPSFSRLQLAAALIDYDNEQDDEEGPYRVARESVIFAHTRRPPPRAPIASLYMQNEARPSTDFLGVKMPSEVDATSMYSRRRGSSVMDPELDQREKEEKVDLDSWGLGALKDEKKDRDDDEGDEEEDAFREPERRRAVSEFLPNPHSPLDDTFRRPTRISTARSEFAPAPFRPPHSRSSSLGDFGAGGAFLDSPSTSMSSSMPMNPASGRRRSLDLGRNVEQNGTLRYAESGVGVRFPTAETPADDLNNPFVLPPPSPGRSSRFDPKSYGAHDGDRNRTMSRASMGSSFLFNGDDRRSLASGMMLDDGRSMTGASMYFDADDGRSRRMSGMSRMEDDVRSRRISRLDDEPRGHVRSMSRLELLRPKVLVMPSPLQADARGSPKEAVAERPGFLLSKDGPPLPPGAKTERPGPRPLSGIGLSQSYYDQPSSPFTPNAGQSLTLSQLTFRNSLMKDASLAEIGLRKATDEGEKVTNEVEEEEEEPVDKGPPERQPGRLYGRSLIDTLEDRKAQLRSKTRVFTGDNRPSMMERPQLQRSSTLIDPAAFEGKRASMIRRPSSLAEAGVRSSSAPLLQFDTEDTLKSPIDPGPNFRGMTKTKSTFGVDQIWEKELAKLQAIEAEERRLAEEEKRKEDEREAKRAKRVGKGKGVPGRPESASPTSLRAEGSTKGMPVQRSPTSNRSLPVLQAPSFFDETHRRESVVSLGARNWFSNSSDEEESDSGAELLTPRKPKAYSKSASPSATTLDDTTPTKPRDAPHRVSIPEEDEDDEDLPLAARLEKMKVSGPPPESDSEEDVPLAAVLTRRLQGSTSSKQASSPRGLPGNSPKPASFASHRSALPLPTFDFDDDKGDLAKSLGLDLSAPPVQVSTRPPVIQEGSDDDDVPLGLRHPGVVVHPPGADGDEDEKPLGMRFPTAAMNQQQQAQALQQQQYMMMMQQQLMWQTEAQIRSSLAFTAAPSMMGMPSLPATPFGMPPPGMPFVPPPQVAVPPALSDPGKYNRVDAWRRDIGADRP